MLGRQRRGDDAPYHPYWWTIAVTALPVGWRNVRRGEHAGELVVSPCPAILLQEDRNRAGYGDDHDGRLRTRAAFAGSDPTWAGPGVVTAADGMWTDYLGTVGPGQDPAELPTDTVDAD
jgi:hypothetical protein